MENKGTERTSKVPKRVSFRLRGVTPGSEMNFGLANSITTPVLISPPKLKRRLTMRPASQQDVASLKKELETQRVLHAKQIEDMKSVYKELMNDLRKECAMSVADTKKQQWCINCFKVAKIYCCWNTSYCDDLCQKKHWASHVKDCERKEK